MALRLRYRLGTARLHAVTAARGLIGRARRHPTSAAAVPRPRRLGEGRPLQLTHALVASDLNPDYLEFWPLVRRAWSDVAGLDAVLVLVAEDQDVPDSLRSDPAVHVFTPLPHLHTALQAQCIRLLYPAVLEAAGGVLTSDADMVPMNAGYFHRPPSRIDESHFIAYRDLYLRSGEIPMCYNAALPRTWGSVFGVSSVADVRARLREWLDAVEYAGEHGGAGWLTDQRILYRTLLEYGARTGTVWILNDHYTRYRRLERAVLRKQRGLTAADERSIVRGAYSDFHCVHPYHEFHDLNDAVVELAVHGVTRAQAHLLTRGAAGSSTIVRPTPRPGWSSARVSRGRRRTRGGAQP